MDDIKELADLLKNKQQRFDIKAASLTTILGLTGSPDGVSLIAGCDDLLNLILKFSEDESLAIRTIATKCLINLTATHEGATKLFNLSIKSNDEVTDVCSKAVFAILDENSDIADLWAMILTNITVVELLRKQILLKHLNEDDKLFKLVNAFSKVNYNKKKSNLDLLGTVFQNLTNESKGREIFCRNNCRILEKLLPFTSFNKWTRRRDIALVLRNICIDQNYHHDLLNDRDDILCALLYPLAGPEEFTDEENDKLPTSLQFLEDDKKREEFPEIRLIYLETLLQLCATKVGREILRSKGTYEILREYHKWESKVGKDKKCLFACENVVDILIKKEDEIGVDSLKEVSVPDELIEKFNEDDRAYMEQDL